MCVFYCRGFCKCRRRYIQYNSFIVEEEEPIFEDVFTPRSLLDSI